MNYTKTLREFCLQNKGEIFDVSYMKDAYFEMIPYKTLLKILNRLETEGIITGVSKGVYQIKSDDMDFNDSIIERYISNDHGMYAGYAMYNELGITNHKNDYIEVYTNHLNTEHKTIGQYQLTRVDIPFTGLTVPIVTLLDCIEHGPTMIDVLFIKLREVIDELAEEYSDGPFSVIISAIHYHYSTIVTLKELLDKKGINNNCISIYERCSRK